MVTELESETPRESELTREIFRARLISAGAGAADHGPQTRTLLARLFPLHAHAPEIDR